MRKTYLIECTHGIYIIVFKGLQSVRGPITFAIKSFGQNAPQPPVNEVIKAKIKIWSDLVLEEDHKYWKVTFED